MLVERMAFSQSVGTPAIGRRRPVRLLILTTLFPNSRQPRHGIFISNRLRKLCDTGRIEATVVAAIPWFPGAYGYARAIPPSETVCGFQVRHPRYFHIPLLGMRMQPDSLARALLADLRRARADESQYDVVDAHYFYPDGVAAARVASALDLPLVISARGSDINLIGEIPFARRRMLRAASEAEALIAVSEALAESMAALGMNRGRIHLLRNGVDPDVFSLFPRDDARRRLGLDPRGPWVLGVGNLVAEKGFDLLIRAVGALPNARLLIVGDGPLRAELRSLAETVAPGRIEFRDVMAQSELRYVYAAGDVLGLPSLREGWPNVLLEAMACGVPVVASGVGGVPEIIRADAPGVLVSERSEEAWRGAIRGLLDASLPVEQVRQYALRFGWDEVVTRQCELYESIASAHVSERGRHG